MRRSATNDSTYRLRGALAIGLFGALTVGSSAWANGATDTGSVLIQELPADGSPQPSPIPDEGAVGAPDSGGPSGPITPSGPAEPVGSPGGAPPNSGTSSSATTGAQVMTDVEKGLTVANTAVSTAANGVLLADGVGMATGLIPVAGMAGAVMPGLAMVAAGAIVLDELVNLGEQAWQVYQEGAPQVNIRTDVATAVPKGVDVNTQWTAITGWGDPLRKPFRTTLLTSQGENLGTFDFNVVFFAGGSVDGKGKYLTGVTVEPINLQVQRRQIFTMDASVVSVVNEGTAEDPIAAIYLRLRCAMDTFDVHLEQWIGIYVRGDGQVQVYDAKDEVNPQPVDVTTTETRTSPWNAFLHDAFGIPMKPGVVTVVQPGTKPSPAPAGDFLGSRAFCVGCGF